MACFFYINLDIVLSEIKRCAIVYNDFSLLKDFAYEIHPCVNMRKDGYYHGFNVQEY